MYYAGQAWVEDPEAKAVMSLVRILLLQPKEAV